MQLEHNFIQVTDRVAIDPVRKIILSEGRVDQDNNVGFNLEYDPGLAADRLQVPMSLEEERAYSFAPEPRGKQLKINKSSECVRLPGLSFTTCFALGNDVGTIFFDVINPSLAIELIARDSASFEKAARAVYLTAILQSTEMPLWDGFVRSWNRNNPESLINTLQFVTSVEIAAVFSIETGHAYPPDRQGRPILVEREVRQ